MIRYQALRKMGCNPFTSGFIAFFNWLLGAPAREIHFMHLVIEFDPEEQA